MKAGLIPRLLVGPFRLAEESHARRLESGNPATFILIP